MALDQEDTPTEQRQPIAGVATLESIGVALCTVGSGFIAGAEVHRRRTLTEQEVFLRASAERLRNLRHFCAEAESLLIAIAGYSIGREIRSVPDRVTNERERNMSRLRIACMSIGTALLAAAGVSKFAAGYPTLAVGFLVGGTALTALAVNLPAPKVQS